MQSEKVKAYLAFGAVSFFWGTTYLAIRIGVEVLPPALFAGVRFLLAGLILFTALLARGYKAPNASEWKHQAIIGIALLVLGNGVVVWAEQFVPSSLAALIVATLPFSIVTIEAALGKGDRLTGKKMLGLMIGFAGLVLLLWPDLQGAIQGTYLLGIIGLLLAPVFWSAGSIYSKYRQSTTRPFMAAAIQMIIAGLLLSLIGILSGELARFHFSVQGFAAISYLIVFGSILGYGSYIYALDKLPPSVVSMYAYINPVVAVFLGWLILDERLDLLMIIATVVILSGVVLVKSAQTKTKSDKSHNLAVKPDKDKSLSSPVAPCID